MTLQFDDRGLLMPYERVALSLDEFEDFFVTPFDENSSRHEIFQNYVRYIEAFGNEIAPVFTQWLNGSFLTRKRNPRDLDFVTFLDFSIAEEKEALLERRFLNRGAISWYGLDAYVEQIFPDEHSNHMLTQSDLAYWNSWFSRTRTNRAGRTFSKGYVEIQYSF